MSDSASAEETAQKNTDLPGKPEAAAETAEISVSPAKPKPQTPRAGTGAPAEDIEVLYSRTSLPVRGQSRKSQTVHLLQDRLAELGFTEGRADQDGYNGELTQFAVAAWQKDSKHPETGVLTAEEFVEVFKGAKGIKAVVDTAE